MVESRDLRRQPLDTAYKGVPPRSTAPRNTCESRPDEQRAHNNRGFDKASLYLNVLRCCDTIALLARFRLACIYVGLMDELIVADHQHSPHSARVPNSSATDQPHFCSQASTPNENNMVDPALREELGSALLTALASVRATAVQAEATTSLPFKQKKNRKLCSMNDCRSQHKARVFGPCDFCHHNFCALHRSIEEHSCPGAQQAKQEQRERLREEVELGKHRTNKPFGSCDAGA